MKRLCAVAVLLAEFNFPFVAAKQKKTPNVDWYFPVIFGPGATLLLKVSAMPNSTTKGIRRIILQPWLPDGSPRERITADIRARVATEVRVDMSLERTDIGWMQLITDRGKPIKVEVADERLEGDTLTTAHQPPFDPLRPQPRASRHVTDLLQAGNNLALIVMNVSGRPIEVGACDEDYFDCLPSSPRTVMPQATAVIPIPNPHLRYVAVEYSGAFVAMIWDLRDHGVSIQTFKTDSTIKYSPVK